MRARDSNRLTNRGPASPQDDAGPSLRLRLLTGYFTVCGVAAVGVALVFAVLAVRRSPLVAELGPRPMLVLAFLLISGAAWILTGRALADRRRRGALMALGALLLPAERWIAGAPLDEGELLVILVGAGIIATVWSELRG
jgi:hypothetical protein